MTFSRTEITALLDRHGLAPRRAFGQNFVIDANTVRKIARLADVGAGDFVLEIGAGLGPMAGKAWRIGIMGHACTKRNVDLVLAALKEVL